MPQDPTRILLTCLGYASQTEKTQRLASVSAQEWRAIPRLALLQGVAPLAYHHLKKLGILLPGDTEEELKQEYWKNIRRNIRLYQELGDLLQRLHEKDIGVIVLKGAYLAELVYETIGVRNIGDVDLLVKREHLLGVEQELLALGYKPKEPNRVIAQDNHHFSYVLPRNGFCVEIHWLLVGTQPCRSGLICRLCGAGRSR